MLSSVSNVDRMVEDKFLVRDKKEIDGSGGTCKRHEWRYECMMRYGQAYLRRGTGRDHRSLA